MSPAARSVRSRARWAWTRRSSTRPSTTAAWPARTTRPSQRLDIRSTGRNRGASFAPEGDGTEARLAHKRGSKALIALCAFVLTLLLLPPALASAVTFTVNSDGDQADTDVGVDGCDVGGGVCTLRAAIQEANANATLPDTIDFSGVSGQI